MGRVYLVTGANRGIGLGITRALAARGDRVIACSRKPARSWPAGVRWIRLDVADDRSIARLVGALAGEPVDVLINNAGVSETVAGRSRSGPALGKLQRQTLDTLFQTNAAGPLMLTQAVLCNLERGDSRFVVNLSSDLASIGGNTLGRWYAYRASKTALNMITRCLAVELAPRRFTCVAVSPGWARTAMGGRQAPMSVATSVKALVRLFDRVTREDSGKFLSYDGKSIGW